VQFVPMHPEAVVATTDAVSQAIVGGTLVLLFVLLTLEKTHRVLLAVVAVSLLWVVTYLTPYHLISFEGAQAALDLNVLLLLAGMMAVVGVLRATGPRILPPSSRCCSGQPASRRRSSTT
jgi:di/tricarboxylate transporter